MGNLYFDKFPKITFDAFGVVDVAALLPDFPVKTKTKTFSITLIDLFVRAGILKNVINDTHAYYSYIWKQGDRPDTVARKYYGDEKYFWLVFYSNGAYELKMDFPLDQDAFIKYLFDKYKDDAYINNFISTNYPLDLYPLLGDPDSIARILDAVPHHIQTSDGIVTDTDSPFLTMPRDPSAPQLTLQNKSYYDYEYELNEKNRTIKLVSREYASQIDYELRKLLANA